MTVSAADNRGGTSSQTFTIGVTDVAPSQPTDGNAAANTVSEGASNGDTVGVTQYACGLKEVNNAERTWRDAEDGVLSGNPIAQGSVDSTLGVTVPVPASGTGELYYWLAAGKDFREVSTIDAVVRDKTPGDLLRRTRSYWRLWARKDRREHGDLSDLLWHRASDVVVLCCSLDCGAGHLTSRSPRASREEPSRPRRVRRSSGIIGRAPRVSSGHSRTVQPMA